jgi:hypothetical protein
MDFGASLGGGWGTPGLNDGSLRLRTELEPKTMGTKLVEQCAKVSFTLQLRLEKYIKLLMHVFAICRKHVCTVAHRKLASLALVLRMGESCRKLSKSQVLRILLANFSSWPASVSKSPPRSIATFRASGHALSYCWTVALGGHQVVRESMVPALSPPPLAKHVGGKMAFQ